MSERNLSESSDPKWFYGALVQTEGRDTSEGLLRSPVWADELLSWIHGQNYTIRPGLKTHNTPHSKFSGRCFGNSDSVNNFPSPPSDQLAPTYSSVPSGTAPALYMG